MNSVYKSNKTCVRISINTLFELKSLSPLLRYSNSVEQLLYDLEVCVALMSHVGILVYTLVSIELGLLMLELEPFLILIVGFERIFVKISGLLKIIRTY